MSELDINTDEIFNIPINAYVDAVKDKRGLPKDIHSLLVVKEYVGSWLVTVMAEQDKWSENKDLIEQNIKLRKSEAYLDKRSEGKVSVDDAKAHAEIQIAKEQLEYIEAKNKYSSAKNIAEFLKDHLQDIRQKIAILRDEKNLDNFIEHKSN